MRIQKIHEMERIETKGKFSQMLKSRGKEMKDENTCPS